MQKSFIHPISLCIAIIAGLSLLSCTPTKDTTYFQNLTRDTAIHNMVSKDFDIKIHPDDFLMISITASDSPESLAKFNSPQISPSSGNAVTGNNNVGYLVDKLGDIQLYKFGTIHAAGLTRLQLKDKIQGLILDTKLLKDPVVTVRFLNQHVTVLGEVNKPQTVPMQNDQITLLDALSASGDVTSFARKDNILIIRQTDKGKEFKRVNLLDNTIFTSPYYYLQNDDIVVVESIQKGKKQQTRDIISYAISGASLLFLIIDRITRK